MPGASPETMASAVATPLERQFSTIAGVKQMSSSNTQGSTRSPYSSRSTATSTPPRRTSRRPSPRPAGCCRRTCPRRRPIKRRIRPSSQFFTCRSASTTVPIYTVDEYAETLLAQRMSMVSGVSRVQVFGAASTPCGCRWIRTRWRPETSASTKCRAPSAEQREPADGQAVRGAPGLHGAIERAVDQRSRLPAVDRGLQERQSRPAE